MLKPFPPFVASLHVTVRIEPLSRAIDEDAVSEKLVEGIRDAAFSAIGSTDWKSFRVNVDKVAPEGEASPIAWLDQLANLHRGIFKAITAELVRQAQDPLTTFALPALLRPEDALASNVLTVDGRLDVDALTSAICAALKA